MITLSCQVVINVKVLKCRYKQEPPAPLQRLKLPTFSLKSPLEELYVREFSPHCLIRRSNLFPDAKHQVFKIHLRNLIPQF